jgi:kojibiose phosphorylase
MARKQRIYESLLDQISPADLLPGVADLLDQLDEAGVPYAIASASKNARAVCDRLGIVGRLAMLADGNSVQRQKPSPDLFRFAAAGLGVPALRCLVIEDAAAGVMAAQAAGMAVMALGPTERFAPIDRHYGRVTLRDDLQGVTLAELRQAAAHDHAWSVIQDEFTPETQHHMETIFTLGNGYFSSRGSFEEGYPDESATTFAHGIWDDAPVVFTELVNLPNWFSLTIQVDDDTFRMDRGTVLDFHRSSDLRQGILRRDVLWRAPNGKILDLHFERFHAYQDRHLGAIRVLVTAVSEPCAIRVRAGIDGHVANQDLLHLRLEDQGHQATNTVWLQARTRHTGREIGVAARVEASVSTEPNPTPTIDACPGFPAVQVVTDLLPGQTLQVDKIVSLASRHEWEETHPIEATIGQTMAEHVHSSYDDLRVGHSDAWREKWQQGDVIIEGDPEAQLAIRFNLFQLLVAAPQQTERASIGAKTLSGYGYRGHIFWDTEIFMLPYLIYTNPELARNMLLYRYHCLPGARRKASRNGFVGAQFPWESAETGDEVTPVWVPHWSDPTLLVRIWTGDIQIHITADIAYAIMQYWRITGDDAFMRDYGAEMILEGARFWASRVEPEKDVNGRTVYSIRNVIGPDEYHDHVDNNSFTNYMCRWHLRVAQHVADWLEQQGGASGPPGYGMISAEERAAWATISDNIRFLYDPNTRVIEQFEGFFDRRRVDPEMIRTADRSMQLILGIEGANEHQILKQADVIMLLCLFRDAFDRQTWRINWDTYMPLTDHRYGSSLGPSFHAWAACETGQPDEAYTHFMLAALADLRNPRGNAEDGIHAASTGGVWQAAVFGFAGLHQSEDGWTVTPRLPGHWLRLAFRYQTHGQDYAVDIQQEGGDYRITHERVDRQNNAV